MKTLKRLNCLMLTMLFLFGCCRVFGWSASAAEYQHGDIIEFGNYPKTRITDEALIFSLETAAAAVEWRAQGYSASDDTEYSFFKDVELDGTMYRAIRFTRYYGSAQARYGYQTNTVYWFRFEPIQWTVLDPDSGLLIANAVLDVQPINNVIYNTQYSDPDSLYYLNNYAHSSIRGWLNMTFMDAAFSETEAEVIVLREQDNDLSDMDDAYARYACENTSDDVFLLSYSEVGNETWFPDNSSRIRVGTEYARALGVENYHNQDPSIYPDNDYWFLRSPDTFSNKQGYISTDGAIYSGMDSYSFDVGVCPAVYIDLDAYDHLNGTDEPETSPYDNLTFSFEDGILFVSGNGVVPTVQNVDDTPFSSYAGDCSVIVIGAGIESIQAHAFWGLDFAEMLILQGPTELKAEAFAFNSGIDTVICANTVQFDSTSFSPDIEIAVYEPKSLAHSGDLPTNCTVLPYSFSEDTLYIEGAVQMDTYALLDLMAVMCNYYDDIRFVRFDSYTSLDVPFYVYDKGAKAYVPAENNTLTGVSFSVKVSEDEEWLTITFNEFCDLGASNRLGTFRLVADLEVGEEGGDQGVEEPVQESVFQIVEQAVRKVLKWITTLINKLFSIFSKL